MDLISKYEVILYFSLWNKILDWIIIKISLSIMILFVCPGLYAQYFWL